MTRALLFALVVSCHGGHAVPDAGPKIEDALSHACRLPRDRVWVTDRPLELRTPAVVFVLAAWSAQSIIALRQLTTILAADPFAPQLAIVDTDDAAAVSKLEPVSGAGETFWVRDGKIVASIMRYDELSEAAVKKNNTLLR